VVNIAEKKLESSKAVAIRSTFCNPVIKRNLNWFDFGFTDNVSLVNNNLSIVELKIPTPIISPSIIGSMIVFIANLK